MDDQQKHVKILIVQFVHESSFNNGIDSIDCTYS